jgi:hypothetical protein
MAHLVFPDQPEALEVREVVDRAGQADLLVQQEREVMLVCREQAAELDPQGPEALRVLVVEAERQVPRARWELLGCPERQGPLVLPEQKVPMAALTHITLSG